MKSFQNEKLQTKEDYFDIVLAILISRVRYTSYENYSWKWRPTLLLELLKWFDMYIG